MTDHRGRAEGSDEAGRRIIIETGIGRREIALTRGRLAALGIGSLIGLSWMVTASAGFLISLTAPGGAEVSTARLTEGYKARIGELSAALADTANGAESADRRAALAFAKISAQQDQLTGVLSARRELEAGLEQMRLTLARSVEGREAEARRAEALGLEIAALRQSSEGAPEQIAELNTALEAVAGALGSTVRTRDTIRTDLEALETELATMQLRMEVNSERQETMIASLEDAVQVSFAPLEGMFEQAGLDVDSLVNGVRRSYSGTGGPLTPAAVAPSALADPKLTERYESLMSDLDRMNMMRIAGLKVPYIMPLRAAYRFTSGFGPRNGRPHNGVDLAGPRGTPIYATADGVVVHARTMNGFGKMVRIKHSYGFETVYAHLDKINVKAGDRIARGDQIGDMGNTGRSTGVHVHYEVRLDGKPVNPMTYIKAAQNVF